MGVALETFSMRSSLFCRPLSAPMADRAKTSTTSRPSTRPRLITSVSVEARSLLSSSLAAPTFGKSTLFNRLIGDERSIVHDMAGTTRDAVDTVVETPEGHIRFVDTAGMRRKSKIDEGAEYFSMVRALQAIDNADAALLVLDATEGVTHQDQRLAERIDASGCPIVVILNKWDTLDNEQRLEAVASVEDRLAFLGYAPILKVSALSGFGVHKLMPLLSESISQYHMRVPTRELNDLIAEAQTAAPGAAKRGFCMRPRERPIRPRSPCLRTAICLRSTCGTSSARSGSVSTSGRPR